MEWIDIDSIIVDETMTRSLNEIRKKESELDFTGTKEMLLAIISGAVIYILKSFKFISFNLILNG